MYLGIGIFHHGAELIKTEILPLPHPFAIDPFSLRTHPGLGEKDGTGRIQLYKNCYE